MGGGGSIGGCNGEILMPRCEPATKILYERRRVKLDDGARKMTL
jgi:hypothetical protein